MNKANNNDFILDFETLKLITQNSFDVISILGVDGKIKFVSNSVETITGYTSQERKDRLFTELMHPDDKEKILDKLKNSKASTDKVEFRIKHKKGHWVWIEANAKDFRHNPKISGIIINSRDITERKKIEQRLKRQSSAITQSPSIVVITDTEGKITFANLSFEKATGYSLNEIIGRTPNILKSGIHTEEFYKNIWDTIKSGEHWKGEIYNRKKDGSYFWELVNISPIKDEYENVTNYLKTSEDITERKLIEEKHKTLFEAANDAIILADVATGKIIDANKKTEKLLGRTRKEIIGMHQSQLHPTEEKEKAISSFKEDISLVDNIVMKKFHIQHKKGHKIPVEINPNIIEINNKKYVYGIFRDISIQSKAEQALRESEAKYKKLIIKSTDVIWTQDLNFKTTYMSESVEKMLGYTIEEYLSMPVQQRLPEESIPIVVKELTENLQKVKSGEADVETHTFKFEMLHKHKNGKTIWGEVNCSFLYDENKNITGVHGITRDISDRKEAEKALKSSEAKYRSIIENSSPIIFTIDMEGNFLLSEGKSLEVIGLQPGQVVGMSAFEVYKDYPAIISGIKDALSGRTSRNIIEVKGNYFDIFYTPNIDDSGNFDSISGMAIDITERFIFEQALRESEEKYSKLFSNSLHPIFLLNKKGDIIQTNQAVENILGYSKDELPKMNISDFEALQSQEEINQKIDELFKSRKKLTFETIHRTKQGKLLNVIVNASRIKIKEEECILAAIHDITSIRQAEYIILENENRLKSLVGIFQKDFSNSKDLLDFTLEEAKKLTKSKLGYIFFYNEKNERFRLYTWSKEVLDVCRIENPQTIYDLQATGLWGEVVRQRKAIIVNDFQAPNELKKSYPTGHAELTNFLSIPVIVENEIVAVIGVANKPEDYTETDILHLTILTSNAWKIISKIEHKTLIEKQKEELEEANATKDRFISIIGHDLRTPFNSILGFADLVVRNIDKYDKDKIKEFVENLYHSARNTFDLLNSLFEWSRIQRDKISFNPVNTDLSYLVQESYMNLQHIADKKEIKISADVPEEFIVEIDAEMIKTVLRNLLSNSIKYTNHNGEIKISAKKYNDNVEIKITDNGVGMSEKVINTLFKIDETNSRQGTHGEQGTGFGLLLSKEFIDKHKGQITVESTEGEGSIFTIILPVEYKI